MKSSTKTLYLAGAVLAAATIGATSVQADETQPVNDSSTQSPSQTALTQAQGEFDQAKLAQDQAQVAVDKQQAIVNAAEQTANQNAQAVTAATAAVTTAEQAYKDEKDKNLVGKHEAELGLAQEAQTAAQRAMTAAINRPDRTQTTVTNEVTESTITQDYATTDMVKNDPQSAVDQGLADIQPASGKIEMTRNLTDDESKTFNDQGVVTYTPNVESVAKHVVNLVNQVKDINGIATQPKVFDENFQRYAQARADEVARKGVVSHKTDLTNADIEAMGVIGSGHSFPYDKAPLSQMKGSEAVGSYDVKFGYNAQAGTTFEYVDNEGNILSDEELAYTIVRVFMNDYGNYGTALGHARVLLDDSTNVGVGIAITDVEPETDTFNNVVPGMFRAKVWFVYESSFPRYAWYGDPIPYEYVTRKRSETGVPYLRLTATGEHVQNLPFHSMTIDAKTKEPDWAKLNADIKQAEDDIAKSNQKIVNAKAVLEDLLGHIETAKIALAEKEGVKKTSDDELAKEQGILADLTATLRDRQTNVATAQARLDAANAVVAAEEQAKREAEEAARRAEQAKREAEEAARKAQEQAKREAEEAARKAQEQANQKTDETAGKGGEQQNGETPNGDPSESGAGATSTTSDAAPLFTTVSASKTAAVQTAQTTQEVIDRRGVTDYQAALPQTGEKDVAVYSLLGLGMLGLAGVATRKRQGN